MSALNCFLTPDAAHVFSDGASYSAQTYEVVGFASKVIPIPHFNAVISATGPNWISILLAGMLAEIRAADFDDLASTFAETAKAYDEKARKMPGAGPYPFGAGDFVAGLAGWSVAEDRPVFISLRSFNSPEAPAFEAVKSTRFINSAQSDGWDRSILNMKFDPERPAETGLEIMRAQRAKKFTSLTDGKLTHAIGGFCQHTTVTRDGISMKVLERWPDQIGQRIRPAA